MAEAASPHLSANADSPPPGIGGARIGRPPQWTESKSRKLARLYVYTTLSVDNIIKAVFPNENVKKNSAQKTMHKMFGQDPRHLRPGNMDEMNSRFKWAHRSQRRRKSSATSFDQEEGVTGVAGVKDEIKTPNFSDVTNFDHTANFNTPQHNDYNRWDVASASTTSPVSPTGPLYSAFPKDDEQHPFPLPFHKPPRHDTAFTTSTQMSTDSVRSMRGRLGVSTGFAKQITVLMNRLTIGSSENLATSSPHRAPSDIPTYRRGMVEPVTHPGLAVPGDFIIAHKYVHSCQREKHFAKQLRESRCTCWCTIFDETSDSSDNLYITSAGDICDRAATFFNDTTNNNYVDQFGNTPLHLFASLQTQQGIDTTLHLVGTRRIDPRTVNKAGQTFLHMLSPLWFSKLGDRNAPLYQLLNELYVQPYTDLVFRRDVYGRTFFHHLDRFTDDVQSFDRIAQHYSWLPIPRDAFGVQPPSHSVNHSFPAPRRMGTATLSPLDEEPTGDPFTRRDLDLIKTVRAAYEAPTFEDDEGRNGLHCLAELRLDAPNPSSPTSPNPDRPASGKKGSLKRKYGKDDADRTKPIVSRAQYLEGLLRPTSQAQQIDANHYDKHGNSVLMAFSMRLMDENDNKAGTHISKIIDLLLDSGAMLDARNRNGETALLVAAKHGNKHVVSRLLDRGANLYARDKNGLGIMGVIDAQITQSSKNLRSYGRLEAALTVVAKKLDESGGEDEPSFLDEWSWTPRS